MQRTVEKREIRFFNNQKDRTCPIFSFMFLLEKVGDKWHNLGRREKWGDLWNINMYAI